jgi:hypothetical protein
MKYDIIKKFQRLGLLSNTYQHPCPDKTSKTVYKNIDDALPLYIPGWEGKVTTESQQVNISAEYATKIHGLLFYIDESNQNIIFHFRMIYIGYKNDPCNDNGYFNRQVEKIREEQNKLMMFKAKIELLKHLAEKNPYNPEQFNELYEQTLEQYSGVNIPKAAELEINQTRKIAEKLWAGR